MLWPELYQEQCPASLSGLWTWSKFACKCKLSQSGKEAPPSTQACVKL